MTFEKLDGFSKKVSDLADKPSLTPSALKAQFDAAPEELRTSFNALIDALKKTTQGDSGAKNIGATSITDIAGTDIQTILGSLKTYIDGFIKGTSSGLRIEVVSGVFFTNGSSSSSTANITFNKAFSSTPIILPGNMSQALSYGDVIRYPYIYNPTPNGFSVKITTGDDSKLGTSTPANIFMYFLAIGK